MALEEYEIPYLGMRADLIKNFCRKKSPKI